MPAKKTDFQSQTYSGFWPAVLISERAQDRTRDLEILYDGFARSFQATLVGILNESRRTKGRDKIQVAELMHDEGMPSGIKLSYRTTGDTLFICDVWLPIQPTLF